MPQPLTVSEMARRLGLSRTAVRNHVAAGMPLTSVRAAQAWRARHLDPSRIERGKAAHGGPGSEPTALVLARTARMEAEARRSQLDLLKARGVLDRRDTVRSDFARQLTGLREALLQIPSRLAPPVAAATEPAEVAALIQAEVDAALERIAAITEKAPSE